MLRVPGFILLLVSVPVISYGSETSVVISKDVTSQETSAREIPETTSSSEGKSEDASKDAAANQTAESNNPDLPDEPHQPPKQAGFFNTSEATDLYAGISLGHGFSLNPLLEAGNSMRVFAQWRQSLWLSFSLSFESGLFTLQPTRLPGKTTANSAALSFSSDSPVGPFGIAAGYRLF